MKKSYIILLLVNLTHFANFLIMSTNSRIGLKIGNGIVSPLYTAADDDEGRLSARNRINQLKQAATTVNENSFSNMEKIHTIINTS